MLNSTRRIIQFSDYKSPKDNDVVVYTTGSFDVLHGGHVKFLENAKAIGDYLIVGIHDDGVVSKAKGLNNPILTLNERVLPVLAMKYVDEVIIGAPWNITQEAMKSLGVNIVVEGHMTSGKEYPDLEDPYKIPKDMGIYKVIQTDTSFYLDTIIDRVIQNKKMIQETYDNKIKKQNNYYEHKMNDDLVEAEPDRPKNQDEKQTPKILFPNVIE